MSYKDPDDLIDPERIRDNVSMVDLIEALDDVVEWPGWRTGGVKIPTIFHDEHTASLHIYEDHWHCYATGKGGDVISFYRALTGKGFRAALEDLARLAEGLDLDYVGPDSRPLVERSPIEGVVDLSGRLERGTSIDWLDFHGDKIKDKWGVDNSVLARWGVRATSSSLWIPHWHASKVTGIHVRDMHSNAKFSVRGSKFTTGLYRLDGVCPVRDVETLLLTEGEPDAWALSNALVGHSDPEIAALPNGAGVLRREWFGSPSQHIVFFADTDPSGAGAKAAQNLVSMMGNVTIVTVPDSTLDDDGKGDLAEALKLGIHNCPVRRTRSGKMEVILDMGWGVEQTW